MDAFKKFVALAAAAVMFSGGTVMAQDDMGAAYNESYNSTTLSPYIAVGSIAAAAVIAVIVNNSNEGTAHTHFHCVSSID